MGAINNKQVASFLCLTFSTSVRGGCENRLIVIDFIDLYLSLHVLYLFLFPLIFLCFFDHFILALLLASCCSLKPRGDDGKCSPEGM